MSANFALYPCDAGMAGGTYRGMHKFEESAHGICCVLCGERPRSTVSSVPDE